MHICFLIGDISRVGGTERVSAELANALVQRGFNVSIASIAASGPPFFKLKPAVRTVSLLKKPAVPITRALLRLPAIYWRLWRYVRRRKVDVLVDVDSVNDIFALPVKLVSRVKVVSWEQFNLAAHAALSNPFRKHIKRLAVRFADCNVVLTEEDRRRHLVEFRPKKPIVTIYNSNYTTPSGDYDASSKIILSAGRLTPEKGFDLAIQAALLVLPKHPEFKWIIAGEGAERTALEAKIEEYGLTGRVVLPGNVRNLDELYKSAALFVLSSRFEGFGLVLVEAKSHSLPVVSFRCPTGPAELVLDGVNGYLVENGDVCALAARIDEMLCDEGTRRRFSAHALDDTDKLDPSVITDKWVELFESLK